MEKRKIILIVIIIAIVAMIFYLESAKPKINANFVDSEIKIESLENNTLNTSVNLLTETDKQRIEKKAKKYERAKELVNPDGYINADNITIAGNIGKNIILVDFWTYSCINCQRTLPYLTAWYDKYKDDGFVIVGVHTPEFDFEKKYDNVLKATQKWNITYPVVLDNEHQTWTAYNNRYWPRKYLIDIDGFIVFDHIGEGAYDTTEEKIQEVLAERTQVLNLTKKIDTNIVSYKPAERDIGTPEIYFGHDFARGQFGNEEGWQAGKTVDYTVPKIRKENMFYLNGSWKNNEGNMELTDDEGQIYLQYFAKNVNIVAGAMAPTKLEVFIDGKKVKDVTVKDFDLYNLFSGDESASHSLELKAEKGINAYTFTFG